MSIKHFLTLNDLTSTELSGIIDRAIELKQIRKNGKHVDTLNGKVLAMIFEKSSTRTRVSFEAGMSQLGGSSLFLSSNDTQLGRGEPIEDSARVISSMVDVVMIRTFEHDKIQKFADYSKVPVINALTDDYHPCQLLADLQTYVEHRGNPKGKTVTWVGDGNNMCHSYINAAALCDFKLNIAAPVGFDPDPKLLKLHSDRVTLFRDPAEAVRGSDWIATDVWASMGQEEEQKEREKQFSGYQVNHELMSLANPGAVFMHCLPAHRGEEVSHELIDDDSRSVVWDEAENRLHAQKALLEFLLKP
jgi:ornithine carbamoyltransferase